MGWIMNYKTILIFAVFCNKLRPGSSFNSEAGNVDKHNWLEVVQKSQEYKIALNLGSNIIDEEEDAQSDIVMQPPVKVKEVSVPPLILTNLPAEPSSSTAVTSAAFAASSLMMPTIMSIKQETSHFNVQVAESEYYNNSVCETASVASDLTRMYVSDEDEKPEVLLRPVIEVKTHPEEQMSTDDSENVNAGKRPRVQFFPPF